MKENLSKFIIALVIMICMARFVLSLLADPPASESTLSILLSYNYLAGITVCSLTLLFISAKVFLKGEKVQHETIASDKMLTIVFLMIFVCIAHMVRTVFPSNMQHLISLHTQVVWSSAVGLIACGIAFMPIMDKNFRSSTALLMVYMVYFVGGVFVLAMMTVKLEPDKSLLFVAQNSLVLQGAFAIAAVVLLVSSGALLKQNSDMDNIYRYLRSMNMLKKSMGQIKDRQISTEKELKEMAVTQDLLNTLFPKPGGGQQQPQKPKQDSKPIQLQVEASWPLNQEPLERFVNEIKKHIDQRLEEVNANNGENKKPDGEREAQNKQAGDDKKEAGQENKADSKESKADKGNAGTKEATRERGRGRDRGEQKR